MNYQDYFYFFLVNEFLIQVVAYFVIYLEYVNPPSSIIIPNIHYYSQKLASSITSYLLTISFNLHEDSFF